MKRQSVMVVSDYVGETADLVIRAGLSQFTKNHYQIQRIPYVEDKETIDETLEIARADDAIIGFTLIDPKLRHYLLERAKKLHIEAIDIIGPVMEAMERTFKTTPELEPGLLYKLDKDYFKRIEAIEFAVRYDDGRDSRGITRADIVLIGISRTSKTPLSQYLAHKRFRVANVPLVPEVDPPDQLFEIDPKKCIGLKTSAKKLNEIRKERLKALGLDDDAIYATKDRIEEELLFFDKIVERIGCEVIDVSNMAIEETANLIIQMNRENYVDKID
ncbi:MAG TPA: pyruvate, water dikinase regulatory protein [Pseudogracilibacillus sp.]|nr:pyruvate, water dikinase regulatory protein [Pseudogracilibacillus sp.]